MLRVVRVGVDTDGYVDKPLVGCWARLTAGGQGRHQLPDTAVPSDDEYSISMINKQLLDKALAHYACPFPLPEPRACRIVQPVDACRPPTIARPLISRSGVHSRIHFTSFEDVILV